LRFFPFGRGKMERLAKLGLLGSLLLSRAVGKEAKPMEKKQPLRVSY